MSANFYRSNSSPNLAADKRHQAYNKGYYDTDLDDEFFVIGDRVFVDRSRPGSVAYFGEVDFATGDWVGVVLDDPTGNHDGRVHGYEYFQCAPLHGVFVRPSRVIRMFDSALGSCGTSRESTPLPTFQRYSMLLSNNNTGGGGQRSKSPGNSTIGSYYYDDDYRQERVPSVASLARKLKLLDSRAPTTTAATAEYTHTSRPQQATSSILKTSAGQQDGHCRPRSSIGQRTEELSRRIERASSSDRGTVFNFRPRREQLTDSYSASTTPTTSGRRSVNLATEPAKKGDRVLVQTERGELAGILRFMGQTNFALGEWAGVELDNCDGKNDGSVLGHRYFYCPKNYGLFVPANRVRKYQSSEFEGVLRSTIISPPPRTSSKYAFTNHHDQSRSTTPGGLSATSSSSPSGDRRRFDTPSSTYSTGYSSGSGQYNTYGLGQSLTRSFDDFDTCKRPLGNNTSLLNTKYSPSYSSSYDTSRRPKFDERDLEAELRRSLIKSKNYTPNRDTTSSRDIKSAKPKAVEYTFSSSKYDGNPIARRTLVYE